MNDTVSRTSMADRARGWIRGAPVVVALMLLFAFPVHSMAGIMDGKGEESAAIAGADPQFHFELRTSSPKADSTVAPPSEVRLWFTQEPQSGATAIRVLRGDERVPTSDVISHPEDSTSYSVTFEQPLAPGEYTVMWRSMAADGHVVDGAFGFTVAEPAKDPPAVVPAPRSTPATS